MRRPHRGEPMRNLSTKRCLRVLICPSLRTWPCRHEQFGETKARTTICTSDEKGRYFEATWPDRPWLHRNSAAGSTGQAKARDRHSIETEKAFQSSCCSEYGRYSLAPAAASKSQTALIRRPILGQTMPEILGSTKDCTAVNMIGVAWP
jgi:hypothetical protein